MLEWNRITSFKNTWLAEDAFSECPYSSVTASVILFCNSAVSESVALIYLLSQPVVSPDTVPLSTHLSTQLKILQSTQRLYIWFFH